MSTSRSLYVESPGTIVACRTFAVVAPFLAIAGDALDVTISAHRAAPSVAEQFARDLLAAAQEFYDATVEHNARMAVSR